MQEKIQLLKPRDFGTVMNDSVSFVKLNIKPIMQVVLFLVLPILVFGAFFYSRYFSAIMGAMGKSDPSEMSQAILGVVGSAALGGIGIMIASLLQHLTVTEAFLKYEASETGLIEASDITSGIKSDFFRFLGFVFAFGFLMIVVFGLFIGVIVAAAVAKVWFLVVLLVVALFLGLFYFMVAISFTPFIYLRERNGVFNAISRSFYLVKGYWWQTFGVIIVAYMVMYFASLVFIIPFYGLFFASIFNGIESGGVPSFEMSGYASVAFIFMMCGITIMSSFMQVAIITQYYSLLERKDGVNVMQQIENIGNTETPLT